MSNPAGWWKSAVVRSTAPKIVSERVSAWILARPAGLKWIESRPGGSAVTALPSDIATGLTARFSVSAACAGSAPSAPAAARADSAMRAGRVGRGGRWRAARVVGVTIMGSERREGQRHVQPEAEVRRVDCQADACGEVDRRLRVQADAEAEVQDRRDLHRRRARGDRVVAF